MAVTGIDSAYAAYATYLQCAHKHKCVRRVAQKYYGDIGISTEDGKFTLTVMLMLQ